MGNRRSSNTIYAFGVGAVLQILLLYRLVTYLSPHKAKDSFLLEFDWRDSQQHPAACQALARFGAAVAGSRTFEHAILLRAGAADWPLVGFVSEDWLTHETKASGQIVVSPTNVFHLFNNSTLLIEAQTLANATQLPSQLASMTVQDYFAHRHGEKPPLYYPQGEFYYYQGYLPDSMQQGMRHMQLPLSCLNNTLPDEPVSSLNAVHLAAAMFRLGQGGTIHVLHYDRAPTAVVQLQGLKDTILIPPSQMRLAYPYPKGHLLYRRAQVNITHPDYGKYPMARKLRPVTVRTGPGDVLLFPGFTNHQPMPLTDSIAVSFRSRVVERDLGMAQHGLKSSSGKAGKLQQGQGGHDAGLGLQEHEHNFGGGHESGQHGGKQGAGQFGSWVEAARAGGQQQRPLFKHRQIL